MKQFLLAVDAGNTSTSFGLFPVETTSPRPDPDIFWETPTASIAKSSFHKLFQTRLHKRRLKKNNIAASYVSSVVPAINKPLQKHLRRICRQAPVFISAHTPGMVRVKTDHPAEVGADRLVNARGALEYHAGPLIVVDFGTATTFDCISAQREYIGGVIAPGPVISAQALFEKTAKLPFVTLRSAVPILGKNTVDCIESGLYHGYRGLVKEILAQLKKKMGNNTVVLATGGQADWILKGISGIDDTVSELTLRGLYHWWKDANR